MRVVGFAQDRGACTAIRIKNPLEKIRSLGLMDVDIITVSNMETDKIINSSNVIILGRAAGDHTVGLLRHIKSLGKKIVFDQDDNMLDVSPVSPHYKALGIMPVNFEKADGTLEDMYVDGDDGFDVKANRKVRKSFIDIMRMVDCLTVTTEPLKKVYQRFNDNVHVVPNAIDFRVWEKPDIHHNGDEVRLLYTGAANHREDWMYVGPVLDDLQKKYKNLKIVLMGTDWKHATVSLDYSRIEVVPWVDFVGYPHLLKSLCCDIGIAPIRKTDFNDCRSEIKWVEYSSQKMATVASPWGPYKRSIKHGVTGLLADEREDWHEALSGLIESKTLRERLGNEAYKECRKKFNLDFVADKWVEVFQGVTK